MPVLCLTRLGAHAPLKHLVSEVICKSYTQKPAVMPVWQISLQFALWQGHRILYSAHIMSNNNPDPSNNVIQVSDMEKASCYCYSIHSENSKVRVTCGFN